MLSSEIRCVFVDLGFIFLPITFLRFVLFVLHNFFLYTVLSLIMTPQLSYCVYSRTYAYHAYVITRGGCLTQEANF